MRFPAPLTYRHLKLVRIKFYAQCEKQGKTRKIEECCLQNEGKI